MEPTDIQETLALHSQNINGLMENQLALVAQVQVLQAALASALLHQPDRQALLETFQKYMKVSKESAPQLASRMEALEAGMLALLGKHQA
jgi:multidrug efflux pump subunit AcrA (membrane-fusion protein)